MDPDREDIFFYSDSMLKPLNLVLPFSGITVFILQNSPQPTLQLGPFISTYIIIVTLIIVLSLVNKYT